MSADSNERTDPLTDFEKQHTELPIPLHTLEV